MFSSHHPDVVFHAAAHKHVPLMESNPTEAIKNNVFGTKNIAECAHQFGVERFVLSLQIKPLILQVLWVQQSELRKCSSNI